LTVVLAFAAFPAAAQIFGTSARQASSGSLKLLAYYQGVNDQSVNFSIAGSGACTAAPPNGAVTFACGASGDIEANGSGGAGLVKLVWQPWERFQYYALFGKGNYTLSVPSATVTNVLTGDNYGLIYGAGFKASIVPDTLVTPAIALDLSLTRSDYNFNRRFPGGTPGVSGDINQRLVLMTYQFGVESSHLFVLDEHWKLEPYGGIKWMRVEADLKDLIDGSHAGGKQDTVSPFLGLRVPIEDHETFFAEASFVNGYQYGGGLELRFK
jgi:hypothetical protein